MRDQRREKEATGKGNGAQPDEEGENPEGFGVLKANYHTSGHSL